MDFKSSLNKIDVTMKISGADILNLKNAKKNRLRSNVVFIFNLLNLCIDLFGQTREALIGKRTYTESSFAIVCVSISILSVCKIISILGNYKNIVTILEKIYDEEPQISKSKYKLDTSEGKLHQDLNRAMYIYNLVIKFLYYTNVILLIILLLTPTFIMLYYLVKEGELKVIYPLVASYPYVDLSDIRIFPIIYLHQCWSAITTLASVFGPDFIFYTFCTFVLLKFKVVGYRFRTIIDINTTTSYELNQQLVTREIGHIIKSHQELFKLVEDCNGIFSKALFANYSLSSLIICLLGFNIAMKQENMFFFSIVVAMLSMQMQIFILCYFGDIIMTSSLEISNDIYECNWTSCNPTIRKTLLIILMRTQKVCTITAYKFSQVNLRTFTTILSTSWSYFALLKTMFT